MILDGQTQQTFNFHAFHSTTLHLCIKIFQKKKDGKGHILTLMSDTLSFIKDGMALNAPVDKSCIIKMVAWQRVKEILKTFQSSS